MEGWKRAFAFPLPDSRFPTPSSRLPFPDSLFPPPSLSRIQINDGRDRIGADLTEMVCAREHDALHLWPVISGSLVVRALESTHDIAVGRFVEQLVGERALTAEQRIHFRFRPVGGTQFAAFLLVGALVLFELFLRPRCRQRRRGPDL